MRGVLNGDEATLMEYWRESRELREMDPLELNLRRIRNISEAVEAHARFAAEMARLHAEDRAAVLEARDKLTLLGAPKPGPRSNFAQDVELARQCYEAYPFSSDESRKMFRERLQPRISNSPANRRFAKATAELLRQKGRRMPVS
jgi:hypothetical protein